MRRAGTAQVIVVGSGAGPYREYGLRSLAERHRVSMVLGAEPTWQRPYLDRHAVVDLADAGAVAAAVRTMSAGEPAPGLFTWDETVLEVTARAAEMLGLPHMSAAAAARCRDKYATRSLLASAGLPAVAYRLVWSAEEAARAAEELGFPVVVKPRSLAGSIGVVRADDREAVQRAFELADACRYARLQTGHGVLVEEYLEGPEISVDSAVLDGDVTCVHVARKRLGFAPCFEEVGHLVTGWSGEPWAQAVRDLMAGVHRALGVSHGVTHGEVRLTAAGPRLVELNGRLGGDLIPFASRLATGVDLVVAAADLALGRRPQLAPTRTRAAEVRFVYSDDDCVVRRVDPTRAGGVAGIAHVAVLAEPGTRLLLPPRSPIPRLAALVAVGADEAECARALEAAEPLVDAEVEPVGVLAGA